MMSLSSAVRVFLYGEPTSMHCSFERLTALAKNQVKEDPGKWAHVCVFE